MIILHIACITNEFCKGVCVAVPQHINAQSEFAELGFINVNNVQIPNIKNQFVYKKNETFASLPAPFNNPDIVIFHEVYRPIFLSIYKEVTNKNIPYIIIPHGCLTKIAQKNKKLKKLIANQFLFNKFIYSAKAIQCLSEQEKKNTIFNVDKFVCGNGIDTPSFTKVSFNDTKILFIFIGRIDIKIKGLDILLTAINKIKDFLKSQNAVFNIVGSVTGDDTGKLRQLIKELNISDLVTIIEAKNGKEKEQLLLESDIFLLTSRTEGMPMGVIEALNYGIPCIVTQGTSVKSLIEENDVGWGCETNSDSLADVIKQSVLERNKWTKKSDAAKSLMQKNYRWNKIASETIKRYADFINYEN